jgi:hypothetical protein
MPFFKPAVAGLLPLFLLGSPSLAFAQQPVPTAGSKKPTEEDRKKLREKALNLLDETLTDTQALTIPNNRVTLLAEALPCLWKSDPTKAREVAGTLVATLANQEGQPPGSNEEEDFDGPVMNVRGRADGNYRLYTQTISKIGNADPQTALELLTSTRGTMTATHPERGKYLDEITRTLEVAAAAKNPEKLYEIARRSLEKSEFGAAIQIVPRIAERDAALGAKLFGEIVPKIAALPEVSSEKVDHFIHLADLLSSEKEKPTAPSGNAKPPSSRKVTIDENGRRVFFTAFAEAALAMLKKADAVEAQAESETDTETNVQLEVFVSPDQFRQFLPQFQKYAPRLAEQLKKKMSQSEEAATPDGSWEKDLMKRLEERKLSNEEMEFVVQGIFPRLLVEGKVEEARKIIEKIPDPATRERLTRQIENSEALKAAENDKANDGDAARLLEQAKSGGQRFRLLIALAEKAINRKDEKRATELLDQALALTGAIQNPRIQMTSRMAVAAQFVKFAPNRALDIYELMVDRFNELLGGAAVIGSYIGFGGPELVVGNEFNLSVSNGLGEFSPTSLIPLVPLALADFDRTRALIDRVRFPEIRARLRMEILKAVLIPEEPPTETPADAPATAEKKPEAAP